MSTVKVAIAGLGNCANSLTQGVEYYKDAEPGLAVPGLMHIDLGGYHVGDVEFVAAFDVDASGQGNPDGFLKCRSQALVLVVDENLGTGGLSELCRSVGGAVIYNEDLYDVDAVDCPWDIRDGLAQRRFFIVAWNLYDQLHISFGQAGPRSERMLTGEG